MPQIGIAKARSPSVSDFSGPATNAKHPENPILEQPHPIRHLLPLVVIGKFSFRRSPAKLSITINGGFKATF
ncbi:hypothetical protein AMR42_00425 [Limnothrix sp. PR1529]|uniref:hypothetical protein n=1 Tax=Limnothrix sp. PR1529 TaxID=1704291 RepID=UPI000C15755C|nr:hypothetical protein [Limnothrix sp. PR1529]PIB15684.1 hypothetical protein AMR42_00425 [Limnothrix sp. PR1529]